MNWFNKKKENVDPTKPKLYTNKVTGQLYVKPEERMKSRVFQRQLADLKKQLADLSA